MTKDKTEGWRPCVDCSGQNCNSRMTGHADNSHSLTPQTSNTSLSSTSTGTSASIFHQVPQYPYSFPRHVATPDPSSDVSPEN